MIIIKISKKVATKIGLNYAELEPFSEQSEGAFIMDVDELPKQLLNFYYMNQVDHLILSYPIKPMLDGIVPDFVFGPSIIGNIKKGLFFDNIPYSDEVRKALDVESTQYQFAKASEADLSMLHETYRHERRLIEGEINRRVNL
ncbi:MULTISPECIES: hypothetical protein [unclassified Enterococcus]|uniref:hypothetical protein n=1 Tax=unclassified Enterococcus TaxID=2608891 RepID=UPI00155630F6|nr:MULTISPECIES: hypothetical protein [unclassified Enterococcus]MBS7578022.1 hypothetical protein [Enterococcus sp. MMGLQ5-2]MBS7585288.1 hypothetical protein [Enterococcus sp. MMGLQ5-1]NPD13145.1 hypothetical protein [Enterococcus sp. MMGLQ5-1]NPD37853.1 hypothetical protein [Enterococcus sp. MMGLQ5-2]